MARYRALALHKDNVKDQMVVTKFEPYVMNPMPGEPPESFKAFFQYYLDSHLETKDQDPADRSVDRAYEMAHPGTVQRGKVYGLWKQWAKKFYWTERAMVTDYLLARSLLLG